MELGALMPRRAPTPEQARRYRREGHDNALLFALEIGLDKDYQNDRHAKKDVIDPSGDAHSVKSGKKKWQIFLYRRSRFIEDDGFQALNGIGDLLVRCIDAFPPKYDEYRRDPEPAKERLQAPMRELRDKLQDEGLLRAFLMKAIFNAGEVNYLTIFDGGLFHVFLNKDVVAIMADGFEVANSKARRKGEYDDQKVLFRYAACNVGELEMRNDSRQHYREVRFNMNIEPATNLLFERLGPGNFFQQKSVKVYRGAEKRFGRW